MSEWLAVLVVLGVCWCFACGRDNAGEVGLGGGRGWVVVVVCSGCV